MNGNPEGVVITGVVITRNGNNKLKLKIKHIVFEIKKERGLWTVF